MPTMTSEPGLVQAAWSQPAQPMADQLGVEPGLGLAAAEALSRLERFGPNELRVEAPVPAWRHLLAQFHDPLVYLLLAAVGITLLVWRVEGAGGWPIDALVILVIVLLNALIGFLQELRSQRAAPPPWPG